MNVIGNSKDETDFKHKLLSTDRQYSRLRKACVNNSSDNVKLSKTQVSNMVQSGGFIGPLSGLVLLLNPEKK